MAISRQLLRIERWRRGVTETGLDAMDAFLPQYPAADSKQFKPLARSAAATRRCRPGARRGPLRGVRALHDAR